MLLLFAILLIIAYGIHKYWDRPKIASNPEELRQQRPRDFEIQCTLWLQKKGYEAERVRFGQGYVPFSGRRDNFISDDYRRYILIKDLNGNEIGLGRCKRAKSGVTIRDLEDFIKYLDKYHHNKGWYFSLYGFKEKVYNFIKEEKSHNIILVAGYEILR